MTACFTPGTACRLAFTVCGHAAQYMFLTARVTVCSAANALEEASSARAKAAIMENLVIGGVLSEIDKQGCEEVEAERGDHENGGEDEPGLDEPVRHGGGAGFGLGAGPPIDAPVPVSEACQSDGKDVGLVGGKPCQMTDPRAAYAEAEKYKRKDAAARSGQRPEQPTESQSVFAARRACQARIVLDRHAASVHPVATTGSRAFRMRAITASRAENLPIGELSPRDLRDLTDTTLRALLAALQSTVCECRSLDLGVNSKV